MEAFPILNFLVRCGAVLAVVLGAAIFASGAAAAAAWHSPGWVVAGAVVGALAYGLVASYVELIRLITDMMVPK